MLSYAKVGDPVYFCGSNQTFPSGSKLKYGKRGEVSGGAQLDADTKVAVRFPGNKRYERSDPSSHRGVSALPHRVTPPSHSRRSSTNVAIIDLNRGAPPSK
jgi:hypothetical protein